MKAIPDPDRPQCDSPTKQRQEHLRKLVLSVPNMTMSEYIEARDDIATGLKKFNNKDKQDILRDIWDKG